MKKSLYYASLYRDHLFVCFLVWLMFTLMFVESSFGIGEHESLVSSGLQHFWGFEDEGNLLKDEKGLVHGEEHGFIQYVPHELSFTFNDVIHLHGNINDAKIRFARWSMGEGSWSLNFWFGYGTHLIDLENHDILIEELVDGLVFKWGNIRIKYNRRPDFEDLLEVVVGDRFYSWEIDDFSWYYVSLTYEENGDGVNLWIDGVNHVLLRSKPKILTSKIQFGGENFSGRINDVAYYNRALKGWEITRNYFAVKGMDVDSKHKIITSWAELKSRY